MKTNEIFNIKIHKSKAKNGFKFHGTVSVNLPCWIGYFLSEDPREDITNGQFFIGISSSTDDAKGFSASQEQANAYYYLLENQQKIKSSILQTLKDRFPYLMEDTYDSYDHVNFPKLSDLTPEFDFKEFIGPTSINIEPDAKDNLAYLTWQFNCLWDSEHGFEVVTHKDRVIDLAPQADLYKIYEDNGTADEVSRRWDAKRTGLDAVRARHEPGWRNWLSCLYSQFTPSGELNQI